jgi:hypothetical protein
MGSPGGRGRGGPRPWGRFAGRPGVARFLPARAAVAAARRLPYYGGNSMETTRMAPPAGEGATGPGGSVPRVEKVWSRALARAIRRFEGTSGVRPGDPAGGTGAAPTTGRSLVGRIGERARELLGLPDGGGIAGGEGRVPAADPGSWSLRSLKALARRILGQRATAIPSRQELLAALRAAVERAVGPAPGRPGEPLAVPIPPAARPRGGTGRAVRATPPPPVPVSGEPVPEERGELPSTYARDTVLALPRDPGTLWLTWDFAPATVARAMAGLANPRAKIRIYAGHRLVREQDFALESRSYYVHDLPPGGTYRAELWAVGDAGERPLGRPAREVVLPAFGPSPVEDDRFATVPWGMPLTRRLDLLEKTTGEEGFPAEVREVLFEASEGIRSAVDGGRHLWPHSEAAPHLGAAPEGPPAPWAAPARRELPWSGARYERGAWSGSFAPRRDR